MYYKILGGRTGKEGGRRTKEERWVGRRTEAGNGGGKDVFGSYAAMGCRR